jgi:ABC-type Mn2+/Zn2+ transport system ATPase subunit
MNDLTMTGSSDKTCCISARHLDIGYEGQVVVPDINFELQPGQCLALVGVNGSGKSTLLKTVVGLLPPISGDIRVLGVPPGRSPRRVAYLSQSYLTGFILPLRAVDVVHMGRFADRGLLGRMTVEDEEIVIDAMRRMGIERLRDAPLRVLSGGQQQRVYIAQTLARRADLVVLDEPTANLDAAGRDTLIRVLEEEVSRGAIVITATQDIQQAAECTLAMLLAHKVVAFGPSREVLTPDALLRTFGIQFTLNGASDVVPAHSR